MAKAYSTINTVLKAKESSGNGTLTKLCKIKSYPDLGGAPEQLETTDLEDEMQTFVPGVQSMDAMEFTANYTPEAYKAVDDLAGTECDYELDFGDDGAVGKFTWSGSHSVRVSGGDVNAVREMVITVTPSTKITDATTHV